MTRFVPMDPTEVWRAVEPLRDELTPAHKAYQAFLRQFRCPRCKLDSLQPRYDGRHAFGGDALIPRALLRCQYCELLLEPDTGLILNHGNAAKQPSPTSIQHIGKGPAQQALEQIIGADTQQDPELVRHLIKNSCE